MSHYLYAAASANFVATSIYFLVRVSKEKPLLGVVMGVLEAMLAGYFIVRTVEVMQ